MKTDIMNNKVVQSVWVGKEMSLLQHLCIKSFIHHGHEYHLYVYEAQQNLPSGIIIKDANEILPKERIFCQQEGFGKGSYAPFADLFRYHLLYKRGGWWVDTDVVCNKFFQFEQEQIICSYYYRGIKASNFVLKFPAGDPFIKQLIDFAEKQDFTNSHYLLIGPDLINKLVHELNFHHYLAPYYYFAPVHFYHTSTRIVYKDLNWVHLLKNILRPFFIPDTLKSYSFNKYSYGIHLWNEMWRSGNISKDEKYNKSCLYEKLKAQYAQN